MIHIKMRPAEAGNERNSSGVAGRGRVPRTGTPAAITEFSKASVSGSRRPRPAGNTGMDYFGLKLVVHVLIRGSLTKLRNNLAVHCEIAEFRDGDTWRQ